MERRKARHQALHILYQREITGEDVRQILGDGTYQSDDGEPSEFCRDLVLGVQSRQPAIDSTIESISENWALSRMPLVDRNILRLAVYEILHMEDIPDSVSINEAVEMAKVYGGEDSSKFVNGVLGRLAEDHSHGTTESGSDA
jgi:N utilization substance protein B